VTDSTVPKTTDFHRGAEAMRSAIATMLRSHATSMDQTAADTLKVVEASAYEGAARLLRSYANAVDLAPLPTEQTPLWRCPQCGASETDGCWDLEADGSCPPLQPVGEDHTDV
jgi:rubrerythrin